MSTETRAVSARRETETRARGGRPPHPRRAEALARLAAGEHYRDVAAELGVNRRTVADWARAAGVDSGIVAVQTRAATAQRAAGTEASTLDRLDRILTLNLTTLETLAELEAEAALALRAHPELAYDDDTRRIAPTDRDTRHALARVELLADAIPKRDLIGAVTRAIADLVTLRNGPGATGGYGPFLVGFPRPVDPPEDEVLILEADPSGTYGASS